MRNQSLWIGAACVAVATVASVVASVLVSNAVVSAKTKEPVPSETRREEAAPPGNAEPRPTSLPSRAFTETTDEPSAARTNVVTPPQETEAEADKRHHEEFYGALANHARDPVDPRWAPRAAKQFEDRFNAMQGRAEFDLKRVECRTSSCTATVAFKSTGAAMLHWQQLLTANYGQQCSTNVFLEGVDKVKNPNDPFESTVYFDCTEERANNAM